MIKGIYFDFSNVIGYPPAGQDRKYLYLNWDGFDALMADEEVTPALKPGVGKAELETFFRAQLYEPFRQKEAGDLTYFNSGQMLARRLPEFFRTPPDEGLIQRFLRYLSPMNTMEIPTDVLRVLLALKQRGLTVSLISNMMMPGWLLQERLSGLGVLACFRTITVSSEVGLLKPNRGVFLHTLQQDHLQANEVIFVGDTYKQDIVGARGVGMKTAWLNIKAESAPDEPPDYDLRSITEVLLIQI
jgi:FMN phosphatase YigB (HAD superfamily)